MGFEKAVVNSFKQAKDDVEGVKNELAFALRRIAKIEELLNRQAIENMTKPQKKSPSKKTKAKTKKAKPVSQKIKRQIIEY